MLCPDTLYDTPGANLVRVLVQFCSGRLVTMQPAVQIEKHNWPQNETRLRSWPKQSVAIADMELRVMLQEHQVQ